MSSEKQPSIPDLLNIIGIDMVVWIDDDFSAGDQERQKLRVRDLLNQLKASAIPPSHESLSGLTADLPEAIREVTIQRILDAQSSNLVSIIESLIQQLPQQTQAGLSSTDELTPIQIAALKAVLPQVRALSHNAWLAQKAQLLQQCTERTLFLIDRQFTKEGLGEEGDSILTEVQAQRRYHCIMLTRINPNEGAELLRKQIVAKSEGKLKASYFAVMSKSKIGAGEEDAKREFCRACRVVFTHQHCHRVVEKIGQIMKSAVDSTIDDLVDESVYDLDRAIYENSLDEGSSELDVLTRILLLQSRVSSQKNYSRADLIPDLVRLRALRAMSELPSSSQTETSPPAKLLQWKREEAFDPGDIINQLYSPLSCGDVFQMGDTNKRYVLLVQPCDVMVRGSTGQRNANEGIFVNLQTKRPKSAEAKRIYEMKNMEPDGASWFFDFLKSACVSLNALELAAYNDGGLLQLSRNQQVQDVWFPGWKKRFQNAINKLPLNTQQIPKSFGSLSLNDDLSNRDGKWENNGTVWAFKFKRIGRIRPPYAEAILGSFAAYHTRAAFDHDFARGLWPKDTETQGDEDSGKSSVSGIAPVAEVIPEAAVDSRAGGSPSSLAGGSAA